MAGDPAAGCPAGVGVEPHRVADLCLGGNKCPQCRAQLADHTVAAEQAAVVGGQQAHACGRVGVGVDGDGAGIRHAHIACRVGGHHTEGVCANGQGAGAKAVAGATDAGAAQEFAVVQSAIAVAVAEHLHGAGGVHRAGEHQPRAGACQAVGVADTGVGGCAEHRPAGGAECAVERDDPHR